MIILYFQDGGRTDNSNVNKSPDNLKYYLEEQIGLRPKLNGFENFLVNKLNIPRNYVLPYWSINLEKFFLELRNPQNTIPSETILNTLLKSENNRNYPSIHKVDKKDQTHSKRYGGNFRF